MVRKILKTTKLSCSVVFLLVHLALQRHHEKHTMLSCFFRNEYVYQK